MQWINETDLLVKDDDDPDKRVIFRQVGWLGQTGRFYSMVQKFHEGGGFSPVFIQREP